MLEGQWHTPLRYGRGFSRMVDSSMMMRRAAIALALCVACGGMEKPPPSSAREAKEPAWVGELRAELTADPRHGAALYFLAYHAAASGDERAALDLFARLDRLGWDYSLDDRDFAAVARSPEYRAIAKRMAAREPVVHTSARSFALEDATLIPEGIAFDARSGAFFLSSVAQRKIVRVEVGGGEARPRDLVASGAHGLGSVLGMEVDPGGRALWAAHNPLGRGGKAGARSGLVALDPRTGALLRAVSIDGDHLLNDVAVTASGDVYVTDSGAGAVHVLRAGGSALEPVVAEGELFYPNGIVWVEDARALLVGDASGIWVIEPGGARRRLQRGPAASVGGIDGMKLSGRSLLAVQNGHGRPRVVRFALDAGLTRVERATILETAHESFELPTTGVIAAGAFHYIANSHVRNVNDDGELIDRTTLRGPVVLAAPFAAPSSGR